VCNETTGYVLYHFDCVMCFIYRNDVFIYVINAGNKLDNA